VGLFYFGGDYEIRSHGNGKEDLVPPGRTFESQPVSQNARRSVEILQNYLLRRNMASQERTLEIKLKTSSGASEADMSDHMNDMIQSIEAFVKQIPDHSWNNRLRVSWDEEFPVDFEIEFKVKDRR
jgi:hypothetical protein